MSARRLWRNHRVMQSINLGVKHGGCRFPDATNAVGSAGVTLTPYDGNCTEVTEAETTTASTTLQRAAKRVRKRGRRPSASPEVEKRMRSDLDEGRLSLTELNQMTRKELIERYSASGKVVWNIREVVLDRFGGSDSGDK